MKASKVQEYLRAKLEIQEPHDSPFYKPIVQREREGYKEILIEYEGYEKDVVRAFLLMPYGEGPFPAILIHHQHNSEWHIGKSEVCGHIGDSLNAFGPELAKNGIVVLAADSMGFEDRRRQKSGPKRDEKNDWLQYYNGMAYRLVTGNLLITTVLNDSIIAIDILRSIPVVDNSNIGVLGHSYGGNTAIFHAAIDKRVTYICASGAACSYRNKMENETGLEMSLVIPGILTEIDIPDIIESLNTRDTLLVSATDDIYSKDAKSIVQMLHRKYEGSGPTKTLELIEFHGGHQLTKERYDYIIEWIKKRAHRRS